VEGGIKGCNSQTSCHKTEKHSTSILNPDPVPSSREKEGITSGSPEEDGRFDYRGSHRKTRKGGGPAYALRGGERLLLEDTPAYIQSAFRRSEKIEGE